MPDSNFTGFDKTKPAALLEAGERVLVIERRAFDQDVRRHFIGRVDAVEASCFRATGHLFVYHDSTRQWVRRQSLRTRIYGMNDSRLIISILPETVNLPTLTYDSDSDSASFRHRRPGLSF